MYINCNTVQRREKKRKREDQFTFIEVRVYNQYNHKCIILDKTIS